MGDGSTSLTTSLRFMIEVRRLAQMEDWLGCFCVNRLEVAAKTVTAAVVQNMWQLRRNERAERNEVEASENQTDSQQMSETQRSEA